MGICCVYFVCVCASVCNERLDFLMDGPNPAAAVCPVEVSTSLTEQIGYASMFLYCVCVRVCVCLFDYAWARVNQDLE